MESDRGPGPGSRCYQMGVAVGLLPTTARREGASSGGSEAPRLGSLSPSHPQSHSRAVCTEGCPGAPHPLPCALVCWPHSPNPWDTGSCSGKPHHICVAASMLRAPTQPWGPWSPCLVRLRPACLLNSRADRPVGWGGGSLTSSRLSGPPLSEPRFPLL